MLCLTKYLAREELPIYDKLAEKPALVIGADGDTLREVHGVRVAIPLFEITVAADGKIPTQDVLKQVRLAIAERVLAVRNEVTNYPHLNQIILALHSNLSLVREEDGVVITTAVIGLGAIESADPQGAEAFVLETAVDVFEGGSKPVGESVDDASVSALRTHLGL